MVNTDRIVPITKIDYLSMIGTAMKLAGTSFTVIGAADVEGSFDVTGSGAAGNKLANQPAQTIDFKSGVTSGTVYFVADFDFDGIKVAGAAATLADASVAYANMKKDGVTLYTVEYVTTLQTAGDTKGVLQAKSSKATKDWKTAAITSMNFDYAGNLVTTTGVAYFDMNVMKNELDSMPEGGQSIIVYTMPYKRTNAREIQAPNSCRFIPERTAYLEPRTEMELTLQQYIEGTPKPCYLDIFRPMPNTSFSTICLPFDLDMKQLTTEALKDAEVKQYTGLHLSDIGGEQMLELVFENVPTENGQQILKANTPYIIQPKVRIPGIIQLQKPIQFVTINEQSIEKMTQNNEYAITFKGVIPTQLIEVKYANNQPLTLLLVAENRLAEMIPDEGTTGQIHGFRGYFELNKPLNGIGARITPKQSVSTSTTIIVDGKRVNIEKYLREGRVYIRMGDSLYTIDGQKVK